MRVDFYRLTAAPLERVLPALCEKVLASGERLLIVAGAGLLEQLDGQLWSYSRTAFLPHGRGDGPAAEAQPILLSEEVVARNGAANLLIADGRWRDEALGFARTFFLFDGSSPAEARQAWRMLAARPEAEARYWKQDEAARWISGP